MVEVVVVGPRAESQVAGSVDAAVEAPPTVVLGVGSAAGCVREARAARMLRMAVLCCFADGSSDYRYSTEPPGQEQGLGVG